MMPPIRVGVIDPNCQGYEENFVARFDQQQQLDFDLWIHLEHCTVNEQKECQM